MSDWIPVQKSVHADKYWKPRTGFEFFAHEQIVPVGIAELGKLLSHYMLGFIPYGGEYDLVALLGTGEGRNLYTAAGGEWLSRYVPAAYRAHPFKVLTSAQNEKILCVHQKHVVSDPAQQKFLDTSGDLSDGIKQILGFLEGWSVNRNQTHKAVTSLADADLLEPWDLLVPGAEKTENYQIKGLYKISESKFDALDADTLRDLRDTGGLMVAYGQLMSMQNPEHLTERLVYRSRERKDLHQNMDELFLSQDDGQLDFNNIG